MNPEAASQKERMRRELKQAVRALSAEDKAEASRAIQALIRAQPCWREAGSVLLYSALPDEPDLNPLLVELAGDGRVACLPQFDPTTGQYHAAAIQVPGRDLRTGRFGVLEPQEGCPEVAMNRLDLVLVPGLGFAPTGWRLGRGRGFYDRLLSQTAACKCGVAFDCQLNVAVPAEPHDIPMNYIVTQTQWLRCSEGPCVA